MFSSGEPLFNPSKPVLRKFEFELEILSGERQGAGSRQQEISSRNKAAEGRRLQEAGTRSKAKIFGLQGFELT